MLSDSLRIASSVYGFKRIGSFVSFSNVKNTIGKALKAEMQTGRSAVIRVIREVWLMAIKFARAVKPVSNCMECRETEPRNLDLRNHKT